jgi:hypothetical protein
MSQLVSSTLTGGNITSHQFNALRDDLMKHHDHSAGKGGAIAHSSLTDQAIDDTYLTHEALSVHVQGAGTDETPDDPGGSSGVHGLGDYVAGITKRQLVCQIGTGTTDRYDDNENRGRGTFGVPFAEPPDVVLCCCTIGQAATVTVYQRLTTSFAVKFRFRDESTYSGSQQNLPFVWAAWGYIEKE